MSKINIRDSFPFEETREHQDDVLNFISESLESGHKYILYRGPVGFGKSPCNIAACSAIGNAYYSTPLKILQDQLGTDFNDIIAIIKGRDNYPCLIEPDKTAFTSMCSANKKFSCEKKEVCPYFVAFREALSSNIACPNLALLMGVPIDVFGKRKIAIIDESHEIAEWGLMFVSVTIKEKYVGQIPMYKTFSEYIKWIEEKVIPRLEDYEKKLSDRVESGDTNIYSRKELNGMRRVVGNCNLLVNDYKNNQEDWIFTRTMKSIAFEPITAGRFLKNFLWNRADTFIFSSGTMNNPKMFMDEIGLGDEEFVYKYVPSIFPINNRTMYRISGVGNFGHKDKVDKMAVMVKMIKKIMSRHKGTNGIIHSHSYENAVAFHLGLTKGVPGLNTWFNAKASGSIGDLLYDYDWESADKVNSGVWLQSHGYRDIDGEYSTRDDSLNRWMDDDERSLFISVNFTKGLDLKDDLARYQILPTIPYPSLGNKRVKYRVDRGDNEWYISKTIEVIEQAVGRGTRTPTDYCKNYFLDGRISFFIKKNKELFSKDFLESVKYLSIGV